MAPIRDSAMRVDVRRRLGFPSIPALRGPSPGASHLHFSMRDALDGVVTAFF
jgi:hypothetical protein